MWREDFRQLHLLDKSFFFISQKDGVFLVIQGQNSHTPAEGFTEMAALTDRKPPTPPVLPYRLAPRIDKITRLVLQTLSPEKLLQLSFADKAYILAVPAYCSWITC